MTRTDDQKSPPAPRLRPKDDAEIKKLIEILQSELSDAENFFDLYQQLNKSQQEFGVEFSQSWTFWSLTMSALADSTVTKLAKVYDVNKDALTLLNMLTFLEANADTIFSTERFKQRLRNNPHVDSLAEIPRIPGRAKLSEDLEWVSIKSNQLVKHLIQWRDKFYAHRDPQHVIGETVLEPLLFKDISLLIDRGFKIINSYSALFDASVLTRGIVGKDDYKSVLRAVRERLVNQRTELAQQIEKARRERSDEND